MPEFLEKKLKKRYGADSKIPYKIMNARGFMHGSKETAKGRAAEKKHAKDTHGSYTPSIRGLGGERFRAGHKTKKKKGPSFTEAMNRS